uniref:Uncharacterized protein n=1 Tax=Micrurus corallinus TaxID=54390 RepID=A0A2D4FGG1_MICCO
MPASEHSDLQIPSDGMEVATQSLLEEDCKLKPPNCHQMCNKTNLINRGYRISRGKFRSSPMTGKPPFGKKKEFLLDQMVSLFMIFKQSVCSGVGFSGKR